MQLRKIGYYLLAIMATLVAFYPVIYFIVDRNFGLLQSKDVTLLKNTFWNIGFYTHILAGGLALMIGWIQFSKKIRIKYLAYHKKVGKLYVVLVMLSGIAGIGIGFFATGGMIAKTGFIGLGFVWLYTTIMGWWHIKSGLVIEHQKMMTFSYAACFAAVTLRIYLPILSWLFADFFIAYKIVAWLCWVPNLIVAYLLTNGLKEKVESLKVESL